MTEPVDNLTLEEYCAECPVSICMIHLPGLTGKRVGEGGR